LFLVPQELKQVNYHILHQRCTLRAKDVVLILDIKRQKGSHVILVKETPQGKIGTVVPMHSEIKIGTLKNVLKLAKVSEEEFLEYV